MDKQITDILEENSGATPFWVSIGRMLRAFIRPEMKKWWLRVVLAIILTIAAKGFAVIAPVFMGEGINALTGEAQRVVLPFENVATVFIALIGAFAAARFFAAVLPVIRDAFFARVTQDAKRLVIVDAFRHAQNLDLQFHLTRRAGALQRIIDRGASAMDYLIRFLAFNIGPTLIELALAAVVLAQLYGIQYSIVAFVTIAIYAVHTIVVTEWRNRQRREFNAADTKMRAISMDTLTNFETVKSFATEDRETSRYNEAISKYIDIYVATMRSLGILNGGQEFIMTAGLLVMALMAGFQTINGNMQPGDITAVFLMLLNIYRPLNILGWAWREIKQGAVDVEKLHALMDLTSSTQDAPNAPAFRPVAGDIRFDGVGFTYDGRQNGLQDVSFNVPAGAFVGIVGSSGAGKSTILKLLLRFYDPSDGAIYVDQQNVRSVQQKSLRQTIGIVPQDVVLFNDTLRFNIAYAKPDVSDEEVLNAARKAQLGDFIDSLPNGLETRVGERGLKLSGGEKQRVGVARAILSDPSILILDEATSSLDSETEADVQGALRAAAHGRTTLAVAHRLSTLNDADFIVVMDNGRIVETGSHDALVQKEGVYADLWRRQTRDTSSEVVR